MEIILYRLIKHTKHIRKGVNNMNEQQKLDMAGITFINWLQIHHSNPDKLKERNQEVYDSSFICKVIDNRMKTFNIDIHIPDHLIVLIDLCTGSNPGMSFMMLSEILEKIPDLKYGHLIQPDDFVRVYRSKFPTFAYPISFPVYYLYQDTC